MLHGSNLPLQGKTIAQLRASAEQLSIDDLSDKIESHLFAYVDTQQTQPFANFII